MRVRILPHPKILTALTSVFQKTLSQLPGHHLLAWVGIEPPSGGPVQFVDAESYRHCHMLYVHAD